MAKPLTIKFFRSEIIRKKLEALPAQMTAPVRQAMAQAGEIVVARAKTIVPVDQGTLRDSIRWQFISDGKRINVQAIKIGPSGAYLKAKGRVSNLPRYIEFGTAPAKKGEFGVRFGRRGKLVRTKERAKHTTSGQPARPFLFPAWRQTKAKAKKLIRYAINIVLKKAAKK